MKQIPVQSRSGNYIIYIGSGLLSEAGLILRKTGLLGKVCIVSQARIRKHARILEAGLKKAGIDFKVHEIPDGEKAKSQKELFRLYGALTRWSFERKDTLLALGGGVTGDLTGFAASTYLRGIPFVNIPTTLLAQVDSAIGGKTGINLPEGKNLVGAFYPPKAVISDADTLATLPARELKASLGEVVKYGMISDPGLFNLLEKEPKKVLKGDPKILGILIEASSSIKAGVVSRDEFETKGERMILNFGHTFGHGFEQATEYKKLYHGEAVAAGMVCASKAAVKMGLFPEREFDRLVRVMRALDLPVNLPGLGINAKVVMRAMARDKKKKAGRLRYVLPVKIGKVIIREDVDKKLAESVIKEVLQTAS